MKSITSGFVSGTSYHRHITPQDSISGEKRNGSQGSRNLGISLASRGEMSFVSDTYTKVDDLWLNVTLLPLFVLAIVASVFRLHHLSQEKKTTKRAAPEHGGRAPLLGGGGVHGGVCKPLKFVQALCCVLITGHYATLLALPSAAANQSHGNEPGMATLYVTCWVAGGLSWLASLVVVLVELNCTRGSGRSTRSWWSLAFLHAIVRFSSDITTVVQSDLVTTDLWVRLIAFAPLLVVGLCAIFEQDTPSDKAYRRTGGLWQEEEAPAPHLPNQEATASFFSRATFSWLSPLLAQGARHPLEHHELYDLQNDDSTAQNTEVLTRCWEREVASGRCGFFHAIHSAFGGYFWVAGIFKFLNDICVFISPVFIRMIVSFIDGNKNDLSRTGAFVCAIAIFISAELQSICLGQYFWRGFRLGLRVRVAIGQVVFAKALALPYPERQAFGVGSILSYMQIDAAKFGDAAPYLHLVWSAPFQIAIAMYLLYSMLGVAGFVGLAVMVVLIPVNVRVASRTAVYTKRTMAARDKRVKFTNEVLQGIRILKLFAWERAFLAETRAKRQEELKAIFSGALFGTIATFLWGATPIFVTLATFILYANIPSNPPLTPSTAYASLAVFNLLRFPLNSVNTTINRIIDLTVVSRRLSRFMAVKEAHIGSLDAPPADDSNVSPLLIDGYFRSEQRAGPADVALEISRGVFKWPAVKVDSAKGAPSATTSAAPAKARGLPFFRKGGRAAERAAIMPSADGAEEDLAEEPPTLSGVSISLKQGQVLGLHGPVGCGKTSLLSAIIGEIPRVSGRVAVKGSLAYCAQEPWIQNMSVRENILFGLPYDEARYKKVLFACALETDLDHLPNGDLSEIGERGINLSGGQKARIALARACYQKSDVYVLDDILSAVDAHVGAHLMTHCVRGFLQELGCTVVIATHHTHFLSFADVVIEMDESGRTMPPRTGESVGSSHSDSAGSSHSAMTSDSMAQPTEVQLEVNDTAAPTQSGGAVVRTGNGREEGGAGLTKKEEREKGVVKSSVWTTYIRALGVLSISSLVLLYSISQVALVGSSWWLSQWTANTYNQPANNPWLYIDIYAALSLLAAALVWFRVVVIAVASLRAGKTLHESTLTSVLASPMRFFDETPLGRIINRLSTDLQVVDIQLRMTSQQFFLIVFNLLGTLVLLLVNSKYIAPCMIPLAVVYYYCARYYRHSSRELQRLDSVSKSPVYAAFSEALNGCATIRAFGATERFKYNTLQKLDYNIRAGFVSAAANRWLGVRLEAVGNVVVALSALFAVLSSVLDDGHGSAASGTVQAGLAGLTLSYSLSLTDFLNYLIRVFTQLETQMVNVERLFEYSRLPAEEPTDKNKQAVTDAWPTAGAIRFRGVVMAYRVDLAPVLKGLELDIAGGEKLGIVGRTGAGKSSILVALFRLCELSDGAITIDGIDISKISLEALRSRLAIIPQDPVLFSGTLRSNLDPFNEHSDDAVWQVLEECSMASTVREYPQGLARPIDELGSNLSMGQRQLVCMGRALLKRSRVLVLDEATASVDMETDGFIQRTLQENLSSVTVLTIAHRLNTIMHCNRVAVISGGNVVEVGPPLELRETPGSMLADLWRQTASR